MTVRPPPTRIGSSETLSVREQLCITFCPTCRVDTIPSDRGYCYFCDQRITPAGGTVGVNFGPGKINYPAERAPNRPREHGERRTYRAGCRCHTCMETMRAHWRKTT